MDKVLPVLFYTVFGIVGFSVGMAGNPFGWLFLLVAAWSVVATIRARDGNRKEGEDGNRDRSWFEIGGGCGGCGGCGD